MVVEGPEPTILTAADHADIAAAIADAERRTTGEIYCVVSRQSDDYFHPAALTLAAGLAVAGIVVTAIAHQAWIALDARAVALALAAALGAGLAVIGFVPSLRLRLTPRRVRYRRAHRHAVMQFYAHNLHRTDQRTGVLLFVSMVERYATVIGDEGIDAKVDQADWNETVRRLVEGAAAGRVGAGFIEAIRLAGDLLARHFPAGAHDRNEIADRIVEV